MKYHNITHDDMKNGDGIRVVLWVSGCSHECKGCQNPITWNPNDGLDFDDSAKQEIFSELSKDYISGITFSGGDPLFAKNLNTVIELCGEIKSRFPNKTIWLYTGYLWEDLKFFIDVREVFKDIDILVDGEFVESLADKKYKWAGSTNQRVIDVQKTLKKGTVVLHGDN